MPSPEPVAGPRPGAGAASLARARATLRSMAGFTLLELMVVLVLIGVLLGVIAANAAPGNEKTLQNEAQRIALLLQLARDEAIVRNRQMAFEAEADGYRFWVRNGQQWQQLEGDDLLRARAFKVTPMQLTLDQAGAVQAASGNAPLRITFGREPVDKPFVLTLAAGGYVAAIRADGIGHFAAN